MTLLQTPNPVRPAWATPVAVGGALVAATLLAAVDPYQPGHYPACPFYTLTGYYCPGCGGLRAVHDLTHGEVARAFSSNPLITLLIPVAVLVWFWWLQVTRGAIRRRAVPYLPILAVLLIVTVAFGVLRNMPAFAWMAP
jgi:hypothetical protein